LIDRAKLLPLLSKAKAELRAHGDAYLDLLVQLDALDRALDAGQDIERELLVVTLRAFPQQFRPLRGARPIGDVLRDTRALWEELNTTVKASHHKEAPDSRNASRPGKPAAPKRGRDDDPV